MKNVTLRPSFTKRDTRVKLEKDVKKALKIGIAVKVPKTKTLYLIINRFYIIIN